GDGSFDVVVSHMALMPMDDTPAVLAEIRRVARRPALLAAVVGTPMPASAPLDHYRALLRPHLAQSPATVALGDKRWRSPEGIDALLEGAGFTGITQSDIAGEVQL